MVEAIGEKRIKKKSVSVTGGIGGYDK